MNEALPYLHRENIYPPILNAPYYEVMYLITCISNKGILDVKR